MEIINRIGECMGKKTGFTLIELLAVIVILAIIALIATPIIMNVINDAREGAAKDSAYGYLKAVELAVMDEVSVEKNALSGNYKVKDGNLYTSNLATKVLDVKFKGTKPDDGGSVTLVSGNATKATLTFNGKTFEINNSDDNVSINYEIGDKVQVKGLTGTFHVINNLGDADGRVVLLYDKGVASGAFHTTETTEFSGSMAEQLLKENTATWETNITSAGGDVTEMMISIPSKEELQIVRSHYGFTDDAVADNIAWLALDNYFFTKTPALYNRITVYGSGHTIFSIGTAYNYGSYIRPTLVIHKSNLIKVA